MMPSEATIKSPRRSLLFTPGDSLRKIEKVRRLEADAIILDLEDAVAVSEKESARETVCRSLDSVDFGKKERLVRLNAAATPFFAADLTAVAAASCDGVVVPKVESPASLADVDAALALAERENNWPEGSRRILALIETALGMMNLKEICQATPRLDALIFGAEDLTADLGAVRSRAGLEILYARCAVVTAAAAYDLQAIDTVFIDIEDLEGLREDANLARNLGFDGKLAIHPGQLATINDVFSPTEEEIAAARRLLQVAAQLRDSGVGAFTMDGQMIDLPLIKAAEQVLERARLAGLMAG
jgi:citrate lyase beta subunit